MSASPSAASRPDAPYQMKESDKTGRTLVPTTKAYHNDNFLSTREARLIRILCEFQEPSQRLNRHGVKGTILFFGSARSMNKPDYDKTVSDLEASIAADQAAGQPQEAIAVKQKKLAGFRKVEWMCQWTPVVEELARRLTEWSMKDPDLKEFFSQQPDYWTGEVNSDSIQQPLVVTTGGGPGIMEAANKGAASVPGAQTMGMGITLPFEKGLNPYVSKDLAFEFHYFFTRKFWMMYSAKALVVGPGGFGTLDELFELLTLRQTGKIPDVPIVLIGVQFWKTVVNWQALADYGTVSQTEIDRLFFTDDALSAYNHIVSTIGNQPGTPVTRQPPAGIHVSPKHGPTDGPGGLPPMQLSPSS